ncbi:hypothetical protein [Pontiella desulfatans]|uniref:hypothetical protein n=1 Tax=Pontiella desulfatans TaxID=2750659 RepID=UPI00109D7B2B|nr:hypothetical protein [Pontiella desulfatans]
MKTKNKWWKLARRTVVFAATASLVVGLSGCESEEGDTEPSVDVTGMWSGLDASGYSFSLSLTQYGSSVSGMMSAENLVSDHNLQGSVSGNNLSFVVNGDFSNTATKFSGAVVNDTWIGSAAHFDDGWRRIELTRQ